MKNAVGRVLRTSAAVLGVGALGVLGSGTALAAVPAATGSEAGSHGASVAEQSTPSTSKSADLHTFATPTMVTHVAKPDMAYDDGNQGDGNYGDSNYGDSNYGDSSYGDSNYGERVFGAKSYGDNYSSGYRTDDGGLSDSHRGTSTDYPGRYSAGRYDNNGYRHGDNGLFGGGLLGGSN